MSFAKLKDGILIKKIIDAIKDIVLYINFDISTMGIFIQAMIFLMYPWLQFIYYPMDLKNIDVIKI